jgi:hypothetical protein
VFIVRPAAMHRTAIVPDHHVADAPVVPVDEHRLRRVRRQVGMIRPLAGLRSPERAAVRQLWQVWTAWPLRRSVLVEPDRSG